jgi:CRISPR/Cas system CMR-associated protein Cmr3 (group 5 of RAMP superfamily)
MFKNIDKKADERLEGFCYESYDGTLEHVAFGSDTSITITDSCYDKVEIHVDDIPKLIKALQLSYEHLKAL